MARVLVSAAIVWWWMKSWDTVHRAATAHVLFPAHLVALLNFGKNVTPPAYFKPSAPPVRNRWRNAVGWGCAFFAALGLVYYVVKTDWSRYPFMVEHVAKVTALVFGGLCGENFNSALWRLGGAWALYSPLNALWSASPAEFWRRWNRPVQEWLFAYVFRPVIGRGSVTAAVVATFAVSGLLHEYIWIMACGRITGYATAFFLVQGLGVLVTAGVRPRSAWRGLGIVLTLIFNAVASVLFFAPLDTVLPLYVNEVPRWAHLW
jgi:hypothetical protein